MQLKAKINKKVKSFRFRLFPLVSHNELFASSAILHFSYHKCLTFYYCDRIMGELSKEFRFYKKHFNNNVHDFENTLFRNNKKCFLSVNNRSDLDFDKYPSYKGSHFIRDPRDLVVSGYRYHLWCKEIWCQAPSFDWTFIVSHPYFSKYIESREEKIPQNIPYQTYLNKLDAERGMILELIWRQNHFVQLENWNFSNNKIIEKRYEDIIGNEIDCFNEIFLHYGFHPKLINRGLELVKQYSLKNQAKGDKKHIRKGSSNQWITEFTPLHKKLFKQLNGELLINLGYEKDMQW